MATFHEFDGAKIESALDAARSYHSTEALRSAGADVSLADDGHLRLAGGCISVTVEDGKVCLNLPLGIGKICLPIPSVFPNGTAAEACINICTTWGIPTGVSVTISILGKVVVSKSFGKC